MNGPLHPNLACAILAGGSSRRMGRNKALIEMDGRPLIQAVIEQAAQLTSEVFISSNDSAGYLFLDLPVIPDIYAGQGPLSGIHAAMNFASRELLLVLACDLPGIHRHLLESLISCIGENDVVVPRTSDGRVHPLCAVYRRSCLCLLESNLKQGLNGIKGFLESPLLRVKWLSGPEGMFHDADLRNLNTPRDLEGEGIGFNRL